MLQLQTKPKSLCNFAFQVYFEYSDVNGKKLQSPHVDEKIAKYYTWSLQTISVELVPAQNEVSLHL